MLTEIQSVILTCLLGPVDKQAWRRERAVQRTREWRKITYSEANPRPYKEKDRENAACRYLKNQKERIAYSKNFRAENPELVRESNRKCASRRRKNIPEVRLLENLRSRVRGALKRAIACKGAKTFHLVGCSSEALMAHLERQFRPGMTWENYGPVWHVDHKKPCAAFDLTKSEQQKTCFHWENLQPLFAAENIKKGDKYVG